MRARPCGQCPVCRRPQIRLDTTKQLDTWLTQKARKPTVRISPFGFGHKNPFQTSKFCDRSDAILRRTARAVAVTPAHSGQPIRPSFYRGGSYEDSALPGAASSASHRSVCDTVLRKEFVGNGQTTRAKHDFAGVGDYQKEFKRPPTPDVVYEFGSQWLRHRVSGGRSPGDDGVSCGLSQHRRGKKNGAGIQPTR